MGKGGEGGWNCRNGRLRKVKLAQRIQVVYRMTDCVIMPKTMWADDECAISKKHNFVAPLNVQQETCMATCWHDVDYDAPID